MHAWSKISQDIVLKNENSEVLILRHAKSGKWLLPGGRLNKGETWIEGLRREVKEEIGTDDFHVTGVIRIADWVHEKEPHYGVFFTGAISNVEIVLSEEHTEYAWVKEIKDIEGLTFWHPDLKEMVRMVLLNPERNELFVALG